MRGWTVAGIGLALLSLIVTGNGLSFAQHPSFDCGRARTKVERIICNDPYLAELDSDVSDAYLSLRINMDPESAEALLRAQRQFLADRDLQSDKKSLGKAYEEWQKVLENIGPGANRRIIEDRMTAWRATRNIVLASEVVLGNNTGRMRSQSLFVISTTPNHPLASLLNDTDTELLAAWLDSEARFSPIPSNRPEILGFLLDRVQMGHVISKHAGGTEYVFIQAAHENELQGIQERQGAIFDRSAQVIGIGLPGLPDSYVAVSSTAVLDLEENGTLPRGTAASAPRVLLPYDEESERNWRESLNERTRKMRRFKRQHRANRSSGRSTSSGAPPRASRGRPPAAPARGASSRQERYSPPRGSDDSSPEESPSTGSNQASGDCADVRRQMAALERRGRDRNARLEVHKARSAEVARRIEAWNERGRAISWRAPPAIASEYNREGRALIALRDELNEESVQLNDERDKLVAEARALAERECR